jgi:2-polyprenyl-3-methyl-5-hydroxy-6-metoxy-1,4-benzoquinol methylase
MSFLSTEKPVHPLLLALADQLPPNGNALDCGCGSGENAQWLEERGYTVTAVDTNQEAITRTSGRLTAGTAKIADARAFTSETNDQYSVILAINIVQFFSSKEEILRFVDSCYEKLVAGGVLVLSLFGEHDDWKHLHLFTAEEVRTTLCKQFEILEFRDREYDAVPTGTEKPPKHWHVIAVGLRKG